MFGTKGVRGISERQIAQSAEKRCAQNLRLPDSRNPGQFCDYGRGLEYLSMPVKNQCCAAMDGSTSLNEGSHVQIGVELARKYRENEDIVHAIEAHHNDVEPRTIVACIVQAADAISAARPGARRENLENYIKRLEKLEEVTSSFPGVEKSFAIQAGREVRIMVAPDKVSEDQMVLLARDIAKKIEEELEYPGQIKVNMIRETKVIEYAK